MTIETLCTDLVTRVKAISSFENRVGLVIGNQPGDQYMTKLDYPCAWVVYTGDTLVDTKQSNCAVKIRSDFVVKIIVDYDASELALTSTRLPLLHEVVAAIRGEQPEPGKYWLYEGQGLERMDTNRLVFTQDYSIDYWI